MLNWQQLEQFVKDTIRPLKGRRREQAAFAIAALCFSAGLAIGDKRIPDFKDGFKWMAGLQLALYAIGAISFVYGLIRVWRLVHPPELPPAKDRPSAIKRPMAFTEADGELFRKLGRESELQKLLGLVLDDQVLMVVVRGASGAGKTSLLRAGLKHILGDRVTFHYWEAVPTEPDKGLLRAIQEKWPIDAAKPASLPTSLEALVNPADALGRQSHVIVLDQFEQLRGSRKIFGLPRRIVRESKPPYRITWVIAFRREFSADWMDFVSPEQERGVRPPQDVSLRLFTAEQAREVIGQLVNESNLKDSIEQSVINNLVEAATVEGEVSPVDIGIGLLVLAELHERQSGNTITIRDYQFAGGAEGLLTQYISRCLDLFPKESQEAILKAMLALRDAETNQRLAEGLTVDELATESGAEARLLKTQLDRLSHRDTRLLETVTLSDGSPVRYRLPHERLIPALYRLTGKLLAEVDQAKLKFQNAFQAWKTNDKRSRYLLRSKNLRLVKRFETQIPWGADEQEKKNFIHRSKRYGRIPKGVALIVVFVLLAVFWEPLTKYPREEVERYLDKRVYSSSLSTLQSQLTKLRKLELTRSLDLKLFNCQSSRFIEEPSLDPASSSDVLAGLTSLSECGSLKKLRLDLSDNQVSNLEPLSRLGNLTQLTLDLYSSQSSNLEPLSRLESLTQLTLYPHRSPLNKFETLSKLSNLKQLTLDLSHSPENNIDLLSRLGSLTRLTLYLSNSSVSNLEPLSRLGSLAQLTLYLGGSQVNTLESMSKLSSLTQLTLYLGGHNVSTLEPLSKLGNLKQLTLYLGSTGVSTLEPLSKLSSLTELTIDLTGRENFDLEPLSMLKDQMRGVNYVGGNNVSTLEPLSKLSSLTELTLKLNNKSYRSSYEPNQENNLEMLSKLTRLRSFSIENATRAQWVALRNLPASLEELRF